MKKRRKGRILSRKRDQRKALLKTLLTSLVEQGSIKTTLAKAKELRPFAERNLTHAIKAIHQPELKVAKIRLLKRSLPEKAIKSLFQIADRSKKRMGGYTRIIKLTPRLSDHAEQAIIEWVDDQKQEADRTVSKKKGKAEQVKNDKKGKQGRKTITNDKQSKED